ncbi:DUF7524 family protein [Natronosalvus caseinilyticus]|uniref:DUF7524 family protein n=1 Tax=Natronosalvus caseinilyticus TaxID=2953747 RepID=UPI0028B14EDA|nr:hypothetical protein [Natronosalvus caseinilyticus]
MSRHAATVTVDRTGSDSLTASASSLEASHPFEIRLESEGGPAHVHCRLTGELAGAASIEALNGGNGNARDGNHYVDPDRPTPIMIDFDPVALEAPLEGSIVLSTGYGATETTLSVTLLPTTRPVDVDQTLGEPAREEPEPTALERAVEQLRAVSGLDPGTLGVLALAVLAIAIAWSTAAVIGGTVAYVSVLIVSVGVVVAVALLVGRLEPPG